jgi:hypothetical protein
MPPHLPKIEILLNDKVSLVFPLLLTGVVYISKIHSIRGLNCTSGDMTSVSVSIIYNLCYTFSLPTPPPESRCFEIKSVVLDFPVIELKWLFIERRIFWQLASAPTFCGGFLTMGSDLGKTSLDVDCVK